MKIRFYIDPETEEPHLYRHGVTEDEATIVIKFAGEDRSGRDGCRIALGQTAAGRYLKVIYVRDQGSENLFVITAYELKGKPLAAYRKRQRRRGLI
ncbi:MAG TPA: hypothetical protein VM658_01675 [bacterium]|nr:hypothetical protein [bacterium]